MVFLNTFIDHTSCRVLYRCRQLRKSSPVTATYLYSLNFFDWAKSGGGLKPSPSPCAVPVKTVPVWSVLVKYRTIFLTRTLTLSSLHSSWSIKSQSNITPERVIPANYWQYTDLFIFQFVSYFYFSTFIRLDKVRPLNIKYSKVHLVELWR